MLATTTLSPLRRRMPSMLLVAVMSLGASECTPSRVRPDSSAVFAAEANDKTVIIEGCGSQPVVGYTYCRTRENAPTTGKITLIAPPVDCKGDSCVSFTLYFPDGSPSLGFQVPKGKTRQDVVWGDLVKTGSFTKNQRGFWGIAMDYRFVALDGKEYEGHAEGEIRLRVLSSNYVPLHEVREDANFVWKWDEGKTHYRMTTAGRAVVWRD